MADPWFKADPRLWSAVADALPKPWPPEAVALDLQWWQDQIRVKRVQNMPGRRALAERWGWTERKARELLASNADVPRTSQKRPTRVPRASRRATVEPAFSAKNVPLVSHSCPTDVPSVSHEVAPDGAEYEASNVANDAAPRARGTEHRTTDHIDPPYPPDLATADDLGVGEQQADQDGVEQPQEEPLTYRRPGPLSPDPEQRAASYEAVNETPQSRGSRNLAAHEGPPTPPPPYRYKGVDLPGRISDLLPREVAAALAVHFKGDRYRSGTQKLFEAKSLEYMRGLTSIAIEDIAIHMDIHWRVRPPALKDLAVPYVAGGEDVRWDAERLYMHLSGRLLPNAELQQLIPDASKRRPILDLLRELGAESVPAGWAELGRQIREAQARAVNQ